MVQEEMYVRPRPIGMHTQSSSSMPAHDRVVPVVRSPTLLNSFGLCVGGMYPRTTRRGGCKAQEDLCRRKNACAERLCPKSCNCNFGGISHSPARKKKRSFVVVRASRSDTCCHYTARPLTREKQLAQHANPPRRHPRLPHARHLLLLT